MQNALTEPTRTEIETVDYEERARKAVIAATERVGGPWAQIAAHLTTTLRDLCTLKMRGLNNPELAHIELCVTGVVADLCHGGITDITHIRRVRSQADREDDRLTDLHAIDGPHAVSYAELAAGYRKSAAANLAAARAYERLDREERRNAARTIERLRQTGRAS